MTTYVSRAFSGIQYGSLASAATNSYLDDPQHAHSSTFPSGDHFSSEPVTKTSCRVRDGKISGCLRLPRLEIVPLAEEPRSSTRPGPSSEESHHQSIGSSPVLTSFNTSSMMLKPQKGSSQVSLMTDNFTYSTWKITKSSSKSVADIKQPRQNKTNSIQLEAHSSEKADAHHSVIWQTSLDRKRVGMLHL